jgi:hypothetical protein
VSDHRRARILIPDTTPLSLLAMVGREALDWLFVPGAEVWVTDMVRHEALRDPEPGDDQRKEHRQALRGWFADNAHRLHIKPTSEGRDYERAMRNWNRAGRVPEDRPSWVDRGERSMRQALAVTRDLIEEGESVLLLVDDRAARALLAQAAQTEGLDADLMATETFVALLEQDFGVVAAGTAWQVIHIAASGNEPVAPEPDPIHIRAW